MPTYDYRCKACGHVFELLHNMSENPAPDCPKCGQACERMVSGGAGLIFKGKGFYSTDYSRSRRAACDSNVRCCGRTEPCDAPPCRE